jgi:glycerol-3-phosphate acyltransferase PlsX
MMSGDSGLPITIPAVLQALSDYPHVFIHLAGDEAKLIQAMAHWPVATRSRTAILHAPDSLHMGDKPSAVLRKDDMSSMRIALQALADGEVGAVVSAGNAGALMILARKLTGVLMPSIRPAFCSLFPTEAGASVLLDLGANIDCPAEQLLTFAILGSALYSSLYPSPSPGVALLSNGVESGKGNSQVKAAAALLSAAPGVRYIGYIEANALHAGLADVVVCDGFTGNIALKSVEGTAELAKKKLAQLLESAVDKDERDGSRQQLLADFSRAMDPDIHNGAFLLGLSAVVVKAHGDSSVEGLAVSIGQALKCQEHNLIAKMIKQLKLATPGAD